MTAAGAGIARRVEHVMGMPISLALRGTHTRDDRAETAWQAALAELRWVDAVFSTWRADSQVSRLGRGEVTIEQCDPAVAEVMRLGDDARASSDGAFDVWLTDADGVRRLDPSGVVKGWAVERAAGHLLELPGTDVCLSAGGDMVCHVADPDGEPWAVGVEDPHDPARLVARVPVRRGAVATSGSAHRGGHVVDARTGVPSTPRARAVVASMSTLVSEAPTTVTEASAVDGPAWLRSRLRTGVVVWADGRVETVG